MRVNQILKESAAFIITTVLSCGVSQILGAIKFIMDLGLLFSHRVKERKINRSIKKISENPAEFQKIELIDTIARRLQIQKEHLSLDQVQNYLDFHRRKAVEKTIRLHCSLKADGYALIPLLGAHISWRVATDYKGKSFTPIFSRSVQYLFENFPKLCSKPFFLGRCKNAYAKKEDFERYLWVHHENIFCGFTHLSIPVNTSARNRSIKAYFGKAHKKLACELDMGPENPVVVIFHHQGSGGEGMHGVGETYRAIGFNVLAVTMGGYPGSSNVLTSEASCYQDIVAIKQYLKQEGVKEVAWHGNSMGTGLALHAAADISPEDLKTLFVVADQPYNSAAGVAKNMLGPLAEGFIRAGLPTGRKVELPDGREIFTDGLDNLKKAEKLKEQNIPLICAEGTEDFLMGRNKRNGRYQDNFASDILKTRYKADEWNQFVLQKDWGHGSSINHYDMELYHLLYKEKLLPDRVLQFLSEKEDFLNQKDSMKQRLFQKRLRGW